MAKTLPHEVCMELSSSSHAHHRTVEMTQQIHFQVAVGRWISDMSGPQLLCSLRFLHSLFFLNRPVLLFAASLGRRSLAPFVE